MAEKLTINLTRNIVSECNGDISILLIDHDVRSVSSLSSMLKQRSYKVIDVNVASEAVAIIEKQKKDIGLVIANIELPHIDSHYFLNAMLHKEIPLILIGPEINIKEASDLLTKRACFCLKKPITENDINNLWEHVVPNKSQELDKFKIGEHQENIVDKRMKQIEAFTENMKRQRISQSSLLRGRPFIKPFTTSDMYQKRKSIANDEWKTKPMCSTEIENKTEERNKMQNNVEICNNLWTRERHMKFLTAISILGEKDSHPKAILKIMNDSNLNHRQVGSHLEKYKSQVEEMNKALKKNELRSTDKTFENPLGYEYPFKLSSLKNNLIESYSLWYSLRKKKSSSSSVVQYSFKKSATEKKEKKLKLYLGGKFDLSNHSFFGNISNKPSNDVNNSGLSSDNRHVLSSLPSNVGASNLDALQKESAEICISQSNPNPSQPSSSNVETNRKPLDIDPISIADSSVPQVNLCTPDTTMNSVETNMNHIGWVPSVENCSHHETSMNLMNSIPTTKDHVPPIAGRNTFHETNTNHMGRVSSGENYVTSRNINSSETNMRQMGRVSLGENCGLENNINEIGLVPNEEGNAIPIEDLISFDTGLNDMDLESLLDELYRS